MRFLCLILLLLVSLPAAAQLPPVPRVPPRLGPREIPNTRIPYRLTPEAEMLGRIAPRRVAVETEALPTAPPRQGTPSLLPATTPTRGPLPLPGQCTDRDPGGPSARARVQAARDLLTGKTGQRTLTPLPNPPLSPSEAALREAAARSGIACLAAGCKSDVNVRVRLHTAPSAAGAEVICPTCGSLSAAAAVQTSEGLRVRTEVRARDAVTGMVTTGHGGGAMKPRDAKRAGDALQRAAASDPMRMDRASVRAIGGR